MKLLTHIDTVLAYQPKAARRRQITSSVLSCSTFWLYISHGENPKHRAPNEIGLSSEVAHAVEKTIITLGFSIWRGLQAIVAKQLFTIGNQAELTTNLTPETNQAAKGKGGNLGASLSHFCSQLAWCRAQIFFVHICEPNSFTAGNGKSKSSRQHHCLNSISQENDFICQFLNKLHLFANFLSFCLLQRHWVGAAEGQVGGGCQYWHWLCVDFYKWNIRTVCFSMWLDCLI